MLKKLAFVYILQLRVKCKKQRTFMQNVIVLLLAHFTTLSKWNSSGVKFLGPIIRPARGKCF